jgi:3-hydroxyisobutyrate dehydrogenase-like beta-hydroxyacid dehydrogenase
VTVVSEKLINKDTTRIGFIGLGLMGSRLTRRLHSTGWKVQGWNRSPDPGKSLARDGVAISSSVAKLVADSDVVLSSLANDAAVRSVYFDNGGVFPSAKPGTIILEMSTISPELSRVLHQEASVRRVDLLDLAISGSTPAVDAGTITLLAGGDQATFNECTSIYESIAKQWFLIGPGSSGILMKLVVNLLLGVDMLAIAEAVSLGEHLRIDRNVLLDVLSKSPLIAPAFGGKMRKIKDNDYSPEFPLRLMSKDMDLVMEAAKTSGADLAAARAAQSVLASNLSSHGDQDFSAITPFIVGRKMKT